MDCPHQTDTLTPSHSRIFFPIYQSVDRRSTDPCGTGTPTSRLDFSKFILDFQTRGQHTHLVERGQRLYPPIHPDTFSKVFRCMREVKDLQLTHSEPTEVSVSTASITTSQMFRCSRSSVPRSAIKRTRLSIAICSLRSVCGDESDRTEGHILVTTPLFSLSVLLGEPPPGCTVTASPPTPFTRHQQKNGDTPAPSNGDSCIRYGVINRRPG